MGFFFKSDSDKEGREYCGRAQNAIEEIFDSYKRYSDEDKSAVKGLVEKLEMLAKDLEHYDKKSLIDNFRDSIKRIFG